MLLGMGWRCTGLEGLRDVAPRDGQKRPKGALGSPPCLSLLHVLLIESAADLRIMSHRVLTNGPKAGS